MWITIPSSRHCFLNLWYTWKARNCHVVGNGKLWQHATRLKRVMTAVDFIFVWQSDFEGIMVSKVTELSLPHLSSNSVDTPSGPCLQKHTTHYQLTWEHPLWNPCSHKHRDAGLCRIVYTGKSQYIHLMNKSLL